MNITTRIDAITDIPPEYRHTHLPAPKSVKIEVSPRCNYRCLHGDTLIDTIYGQIPIRELAENYETIPVFTYKNGEIFVADAINIRKTGTDRELVRVHFDDGTFIDCTPDHKFLQFRSLGAIAGTEEWATEAHDLRPGSRVRAYRENAAGHGYIDLCWGRQFKKKRSRLVMEYLLGRKLDRKEQIHHKNHDIQDDHPGNLEYMASAKEHASHHPEIAERMRLVNPAKNMTPEWKQKITQSLTGKTRTLEQRMKYRASKLGEKNPNYIDGRDSGRSRIVEVNHKVTRVESLAKRDDVYCMGVPASGWFFANKVLVKNCGFCALRARENQPTSDMDFDLFKRITTDMRESGVEEIGVFYLGESFMNAKLLIDCIRWCKQDLAFPYVFLTTNGSLCKARMLRGVMEAGLDSLKFSINAADEQQFAEIVGVSPRYFDIALANLALARRIRDENNFACGIYASSIRYDGAQQLKMEKLLRDRVLDHVDSHYWLPLYSMGSIAEQREAELGFRPTAGNQGRFGALRDPLPCWAAFTEGHVRADGGLSLCCFDSDGRFVVGDLTKQTFMEAWNSSEFQRVRSAHLAGDVTGTVCEKCVAY